MPGGRSLKLPPYFLKIETADHINPQERPRKPPGLSGEINATRRPQTNNRSTDFTPHQGTHAPRKTRQNTDTRGREGVCQHRRSDTLTFCLAKFTRRQISLSTQAFPSRTLPSPTQEDPENRTGFVLHLRSRLSPLTCHLSLVERGEPDGGRGKARPHDVAV